MCHFVTDFTDFRGLRAWGGVAVEIGREGEEGEELKWELKLKSGVMRIKEGG